METKEFVAMDSPYRRLYVNRDGELLRENTCMSAGLSRDDKMSRAVLELMLTLSAYKELRTRVDIKGINIKSRTANFPESPEYSLFVKANGATVEKWPAGRHFAVYRFSKETLENLVEEYKM